jgi:SAM-dependent methyltransferase
MGDAIDATFDSSLDFSRRRFIGGGVALAAAVATPILAQPFFDVPFVPTPQVVVDEMLRLAGVGPKDVVYDLGSGDGRIVITAAAKFGARGVGVELNEHLIYQSEASAQQANVENRVKFLQQDFFKTDFSEASVVTLYLLPAVMKRLRERMLKLKPGTRLVAHDFDFDDWRPDVKTTIRKNVFLWIVPARVDGRWRMRVDLPQGPFPFDIDVRQKYQEIDGIVKIEGPPPGGLWEAKLEGDRIRFVVVDSRERDHEASLYFDGRVSGDTMRGEGVRGVGAVHTRFTWQATRQR